MKKLKKIKEKIKKTFCKKKKIKFIDLATGEDVSKYGETSFTGFRGRLSIPKDDDKQGVFTKYSDIAP